MGQLRVKSLPRAVDGAPVVKAAWLGWLSYRPGQPGTGPGYFCFVLACEAKSSGDTSTLHAHLMQAASLDDSWRKVQSWGDLGRAEVDELFAEHEKLTNWPEGVKD